MKRESKYLLVVCLIFLFLNSSLAQFKYSVDGIVKENGKPLTGATVSIYDSNSKKLEEIITPSTGAFSFKLKTEEEYNFIITKTGYNSIKLNYSTFGIDEENAKNIKESSNPEVEIFKLPKNPELLSQINAIKGNPYMSIYFSYEENKMHSDKEVFESMNAKLSKLKKAAFEELNKDAIAAEKEANYKTAIEKADKFFEAKNYKEAKTFYQEALELKTETYPKNKIAETDRLINELELKNKLEKEKEISEKYNSAITKADKAFIEKDYASAKAAYNEALGIKPNEVYPNNKIKEIEKLVIRLKEMEKNEQIRIAQEKEANEKYEAALAKANELFFKKEYQKAKIGFNEALAIKPNETKLLDNIAECNKFLMEIADKEKADKEKAEKEAALAKEKALADAAEKERLAKEKAANEAAEKERLAKEKEKRDFERKYTTLISSGDSSMTAKNFDFAKNKYNEALTMKPDEEYPKAQLKRADVLIAEAELYKNDLAKKYPIGITEEIITEGNIKITRRIVVAGNKGVLYEKKETNFGATYYFLDGVAINEQQFEKDTKKK